MSDETVTICHDGNECAGPDFCCGNPMPQDKMADEVYIVPVGMMTRILDALRECSEDLRCEIDHRYGIPENAGNRSRYKRDMETANTADLVLAEWAAFRDAPHPTGPERDNA